MKDKVKRKDQLLIKYAAKLPVQVLRILVNKIGDNKCNKFHLEPEPIATSSGLFQRNFPHIIHANVFLTLEFL